MTGVFRSKLPEFALYRGHKVRIADALRQLPGDELAHLGVFGEDGKLRYPWRMSAWHLNAKGIITLG